MATVIKPKLSEKNRYYIDKHRYYELKHFCLQYSEWKKGYLDLDGYVETRYDHSERVAANNAANPTFKMVEKREEYFEKMRMIEQAAIAADADLSGYIFKAVTEGLSYNHLRTKMNIPCSRDTYYNRYRKFFWLLDKTRQ